MTLNREVFARDPQKSSLANNGVAEVGDSSSQDLRTLRSELEMFVCDGQYHRGLKRILDNYLASIDQPEQKSVWISGFYGSGKSHLVKMLRALWVDTRFPDGNSAWNVARIPDDLKELLLDLKGQAQKLKASLHSAAGRLSASAGSSVRLALCNIVLRSAGLPADYGTARFVLWLKREGRLEMFRKELEAQGRSLDVEVNDLSVSPALHTLLAREFPNLGQNFGTIGELLGQQYASPADITNDQMVALIRDALTQDGQFPLTLLALDEVQQFIGENVALALAVQEVVETCSKSFKGRLMFVGTGQLALSGTPQLQKLLGRFPIAIELSDTDVEAVIRKVVLMKKQESIPALDDTVAKSLGEISRHLRGSKIAHTQADQQILVSDYPVLPVRRRFWGQVLRAVDESGTSQQLRNQLRVVHEAVREYASKPLGHVVGADFIYQQQSAELQRNQLVPKEIHEFISLGMASQDPEQVLAARLCSLVVLIGKLPRQGQGGVDVGIRATPDMLADLLVEDLTSNSADLRRQAGPLLQKMEAEGRLMHVDGEYRVQTRESTRWHSQLRQQEAGLRSKTTLLAQERDTLLQQAFQDAASGLKLLHGKSKQTRKPVFHFGESKPPAAVEAPVIWVRDGWNSDQASVLNEARAADPSAPLLFVYVPKTAGDSLWQDLVTWKAAEATIHTEGVPATEQGREARKSMELKRDAARDAVKAKLSEAIKNCHVWLAGGSEVNGAQLLDQLRTGCESALMRLFPRFDEADMQGWENVVRRAQKADKAALEAVSYKADVSKHPVCAQVLKQVGVGAKVGDLRNALQSNPFGWSQDAVDAAVYVLSLHGHLVLRWPDGKSIEDGLPERTKLAGVLLRVEGQPPTTEELIKVREVMGKAEVAYTHGKEAAALPGLIKALKNLAASTGGEAPAPQPCFSPLLEQMSGLSGNDLLRCVAANRDVLLELVTKWQQLAKQIEQKTAHWRRLHDLMGHSKKLPEYPAVADEVAHFLTNRSLLSDPDPVPEWFLKLASAARSQLLALSQRYRQQYESRDQALAADPFWQQLDPAARAAQKLKYDLEEPADIHVGSDEELLGALRHRSLSAWADRLDALHGRFDRIDSWLSALRQPKAKSISLPKADLASQADVDQYIERIRRLLSDEIKNGPLIVH